MQPSAPDASNILPLSLFWRLKEDAEKTLLTAHFFFVDHLLNSVWLAIFAVDWWRYNPHDGKHAANSPAQQEVAEVGPGKGVPMTDAERYSAAQGLWNMEKGTAALVLAAGWVIKVCFRHLQPPQPHLTPNLLALFCGPSILIRNTPPQRNL